MPLYQIAFADAPAAERKALSKILRNGGRAALGKGVWRLPVTTSAESIRAALEMVYEGSRNSPARGTAEQRLFTLASSP